MSKRAFLVVGPESTGTRLMTQIFIGAGCAGDAEHDQGWDEEGPTDEDLVVWRRSVPHGAGYPDIAGMVNRLRSRDYVVQAVITVRDPFATAKSAFAIGHVPNGIVAHQRQQDALAFIHDQLVMVRCPAMCIPYEALVARPKAMQAILAKHYLLPIVPDVDVHDGNVKHYQG